MPYRYTSRAARLPVDPNRLRAALLLAPVRLAPRPDRGGVLVTFEVGVDVLAAFSGTWEMAEALFRQFVESRAVLLAHDFWMDERNPLAPDCELSGWLPGPDLFIRASPEHYVAHYRVVSQRALAAFLDSLRDGASPPEDRGA